MESCPEGSSSNDVGASVPGKKSILRLGVVEFSPSWKASSEEVEQAVDWYAMVSMVITGLLPITGVGM
jgi:hypothetical protein